MHEKRVGGETDEDPSFDDYHQRLVQPREGDWTRPRNGHVRDALINSALDETLARAIFNCISSGKPHGASRLEQLKLQPKGGANFGEPFMECVRGLREAVASIGRSWVLVRSVRDDCPDIVTATEFNRRQRELSDSVDIDKDARDVLANVEEVFRTLWPARQGATGKWQNDWHSWPLSDP